MFQAEEDYKKYVEDIASLAKAYSEAGIEMMVLKGYGLSLNYPVPAHRPVGDVDVFLNDNDNDDGNVTSYDDDTPSATITMTRLRIVNVERNFLENILRVGKKLYLCSWDYLQYFQHYKQLKMIVNG